MTNPKKRALRNALDRWAQAGSDENPAIGDSEKEGADVARYLLAGGTPTHQDVEKLGAFLMHVHRYVYA